MRDFPILRRFEFKTPRGLAVVLGFFAAVSCGGGPVHASPVGEAPVIGREVAPGVHEASLVLQPIQDAKSTSGTGPVFSVAQAGDGLAKPVSVTGAQAWVTLLGDDFESGFPGSWDLQYPGTGPYWDDWTCWSNSLSHSVGCAAGGTGAIACAESYPAFMDSRMIAGPGSLADPGIVDGVLECFLNLNSEPSLDNFYMMVSIDNLTYYGYMYSGPVSETISLDLTAVPTVGNILGESQVWVGFIFQSDESVAFANGAQIDDVVLAVDMAVGNQVPEVTVTAPNGGETLSAGASAAITYSAIDPDGVDGALSMSFDYSTSSGGSWTAIASAQSNTGSYNWTVPDLTSSTVRIRVRADDGTDESNDVSNADFSIIQNQLPSVTVISPNGGETISAGSNTAITYTATDADGGPSPISVSFDYSTNGGGNWITIAEGQANTGSYTWAVPSLSTATARVRVTASDGAGETPDASNANFSIVQNQNILALGDNSGPSGTEATVSLSLENEDAAKGIQADITFDGTKAYFSGIEITTRATGMVVQGEQISENVARIILYYDAAGELAAGSGDIAEVTFTLQGPGGGSTPLTLADMVLSGPSGGSLSVTGTNGQLTVQAPQEIPNLQITALKNPGRGRTMQILVRVANGSGSAPTVIAGGSSVSMTALGQAVYLGSYSATQTAANVTISASDTNIQGLGTAQTTVSFQ